MIQYGVTGVILLLCSYTDIRYRKIYRIIIALHLSASLIIHLAVGKAWMVSAIAGIIPGLTCLLLSALSHQALGYGDAFLIISCGFSLGMQKCLAVLFTAFFCAGLWALGMICFRQGKRRTEIPFVPFLLSGLLLQGV
ncbi:MAG: A24 family peptidase [Clostridiales bacterium]|nr:A24 family peptidase [Clostridiales bacterium]